MVEFLVRGDHPSVKVSRIYLFIAVLVGMALFCVIAGILGLTGSWQFTYPWHLTSSSVGLILTGTIMAISRDNVRDFLCQGAFILIACGCCVLPVAIFLHRRSQDMIGGMSTFEEVQV